MNEPEDDDDEERLYPRTPASIPKEDEVDDDGDDGEVLIYPRPPASAFCGLKNQTLILGILALLTIIAGVQVVGIFSSQSPAPTLDDPL
jgi:hypothetical protein